MYKNNNTFSEIMKLDGWKMNSPHYRAMLDYLNPKCYIEASSSGQYGTVQKVIRNKYGVPVCIKVEYSNHNGKTNAVDYISVDRIDFFEPYDSYVSDVSEYYDKTENEEDVI